MLASPEALTVSSTLISHLGALTALTVTLAYTVEPLVSNTCKSEALFPRYFLHANPDLANLEGSQTVRYSQPIRSSIQAGYRTGLKQRDWIMKCNYLESTHT